METLTVWDFLDTETQGANETRALVNWSMNYDIKTGTPYQVFLDLIGYSADHYGMNLVKDPHLVLGYLELDYLADALKEYATNPQAVMDWIERLDELESR
jgi:hypothetical protein